MGSHTSGSDMKCSLLWVILSVHQIAGSNIDVSTDLPVPPTIFPVQPRIGRQESTLPCGQKADLSEGDVILESPNYPGQYPNREKCKWLLRTDTVDDVYVSCESFDVLRRDYLKIWFDRYYGTVSEPVYFTVKSWYKKVRVLFKSNRRDQGTGFRCTFSVNGFTNNPTTPTTTTTITTGGPTNVTTPPPTGDCQCGIKGGSDSNRIVGGQETEVHEYPWQVGLVSRGGTTPWCGGSLISERHVLTAAHCTEDESARRIQVLLGEHRIDDGEFTRVDVANINDDPDYDFPDGDFSILTLSNPVTFSSSVRPVCLPSDTTKTYEGELATVTGWGTLSGGGSQPNVLMEVDVTVTTNELCDGVYGDINSLHICAMDAGKDSCQGDSGGPLIVEENGRWTLVGVVSFGRGCALPGVPGVYARVTQRFDWIKDNSAGTFTSTCQAL